MTAKQFFKSQTFRCLIVLLVIAFVAGGLLAVLNDVLAVSDQERTVRAIKKIYGKEMSYAEVTVDESNAANGYGTVDCVYLLSDGNYLIKATGKEGYKQGTVTCWVVAVFDNGKFAGLKQVAVASYEKQTAMGSFNSGFYAVYADSNEAVTDGKYFTQNGANGSIKNVASGATYSSKAINNAVNSALYFIRVTLVG